jgi:hypothetical protein
MTLAELVFAVISWPLSDGATERVIFAIVVAVINCVAAGWLHVFSRQWRADPVRMSSRIRAVVIPVCITTLITFDYINIVSFFGLLRFPWTIEGGNHDRGPEQSM